MRVSRFSSTWMTLVALVLFNADLRAQGTFKIWVHKPMEESLQFPMTFGFVDTPLAEAVEFWRDYLGRTFVVDVSELRAARIGLKTPVTLTVDNVPARQAIGMALKPLGLAIVVEDEIAVITTRDEAERIAKIVATPKRPPNSEIERALERPITISTREATLQDALQAFSLTLDLKFKVIVDDKIQVRLLERIDNPSFSNVRAATILKYLLRERDLMYTIRDGLLVIKPIEWPSA